MNDTEDGLIIPNQRMTVDEARDKYVPKKQKRKYTRRAQPNLKVVVPKASPYAGMTEQDCPAACTQNRCVITYIDFCGHPLKGGPQPNMLADPVNGPPMMRRFNEAKKILAGRKLDATGQ